MQYDRCYKLNEDSLSINEAKKAVRQIKQVEAAAFTTPDEKGTYYVAFVTSKAADAFEGVLRTRQVRVEKRDAPPTQETPDVKASPSFGKSFTEGVFFGIALGIIESLFDW